MGHRYGAGLWLALFALAGGVLISVPPARGQAPRNQLPFEDYLLAPVRVHLLSAKESPAIQTTLAPDDIPRILKKVNGVWAQAGLHFYLESRVREEAEPQPASEERGAPERPVRSHGARRVPRASDCGR